MGKENDLISIIITLYNKAPYIEETIFSIYKQTYTNRELIIVDDCSTDGSFEIAKSFCEKLGITKKCKFKKNEKNLWVSKTFERGLKEARGDRIAMCDADDILMKNKLHENLSYCINNNIVFCHSDLTTINEYNEISEISRIKKNKFNVKNYGFKSIIARNVCTGSAIFFKKDIGNGILFKGFFDGIYQDCWVAICASVFDIKIGYINKSLVLYRRSSSSITAEDENINNKKILLNRKKRILMEINTCYYILEYIKDIDQNKKNWIKNNIIANKILLEFLDSNHHFLAPKKIIKLLLIKCDFSFIYRILVLSFRKIL